MSREKDNTIVRIQNEDEYKLLVNQTIAEMDDLTEIAISSGMDAAHAKEKVAAIYLRNLQMSDDIVTTAKKNVAELMTRIQLDRAINKETELVSDKYIKLFKLQNETLKLIQDMEPKKMSHKVQTDDDKVIFKLKEGIYEEH